MSYMANRRTTITLCGLLLALMNLGSATAQTQGTDRVRWRFQMDSWFGGQFITVAPNGTVYASDLTKLYALTPDGGLLWVVAGAGRRRPISLGPDGTIYTAGTGTCQLCQKERSPCHAHHFASISVSPSW